MVVSMARLPLLAAAILETETTAGAISIGMTASSAAPIDYTAKRRAEEEHPSLGGKLAGRHRGYIRPTFR